MKKIYKFFLTLFFCFSFLQGFGQGWPENYEGVMLQGFYWDSYSDTKWTNLESQADELSKYFDLIWIPNSAKSDNGMGYMPVYWFTNYNSRFGTEAELRSMIKTFAEKGTGFIADVVVNHRNSNVNWWDFPTEIYNGKVYDMADGSIVSNDNIWSSSDAGAKSCPPSYKGNPDTGDRFDGCRDLDHTNAEVQDHIKAYTSFLLNDLGYVGFRYDMVKGYAGKYTQIYNEASKPKFSVGEYWDASYDAVQSWIEAAGKSSAAFDFPCKYQINKAMGSGENLTELVWKAQYVTPQPAGMIHYGYAQYAVTFVDNHDTYRDGNKFQGNVLEANAFILCSPGTPCVFLPHYKQYPNEIKALISARKAVGVHNMSHVEVLKSAANIYMAEVTGTNGKLIVKLGSEWGSAPDETQGYGDPYTFGDNYCVWIKTDDGYQPPVFEPTPELPEEGLTIYYDNTNTKFNPVYCYTFANDGDNTSYPWPGKEMKLVDGNIYYSVVPEGSNAVFNSGKDKPQTVDVMGVKDGYLYTGLSSKDSNSKFYVDNGQVFVIPDDGKSDDEENGDGNDPEEDNQDSEKPGETVPDQDNSDIEQPDQDIPGNENPDQEIPDQNNPDSSGPSESPDNDDNSGSSDAPDNSNSSDNSGPSDEYPAEDPDNSTPSDSTDNSGSSDDDANKEQPGSQDPAETPDNSGPSEDTENPSEPGSSENPDNTEGAEPSEDPDNSNASDNSDQNSGDNLPGDEEIEDAGIDGIVNDSQDAEYFTLQGIKVKNPTPGLYIKVVGNKREKVFINGK